MEEKERLIHCYKTGLRFRAWYAVDDDGNEHRLTSCPATDVPRASAIKCNGKTEFGTPCPYDFFNHPVQKNPENQ